MARRFRDDDYDDDVDDRPRRRRRRDEDTLPARRGGSTFPLWIALAIGGGFLTLLLIGTGVFFALRTPKKPKPSVIDEIVAGNNTPDRVVRLRVSRFPQQVIFGGTEDGHVAVVSFAQGGRGHDVEVFKTSTGDARGKIRTKDSTINSMAVSPDGVWFADIGSTPFQGNPITLWRVADGTQAGAFTPYPKTPQTIGKVPNLIWCGFLPGNRLITVNEFGGYDVWSVPDAQRVHGRDGTLTGARPMQINLFTKTPTNFAITPDGATLALFDGNGFTLLNPTTGAETGRTEPFTGAGESFNWWGTALRADGSRLAVLRTAHGARPGTWLTVWDTRTGKIVSEVQPQGVISAPGMAWWGSDHLLLWQGGNANADVINATTGQKVAAVRISGKLSTNGPGNQLWGLTADGALVRGGAGKIRPGGTLEVTADGLLDR